MTHYKVSLSYGCGYVWKRSLFTAQATAHTQCLSVYVSTVSANKPNYFTDVNNLIGTSLLWVVMQREINKTQDQLFTE